MKTSLISLIATKKAPIGKANVSINNLKNKEIAIVNTAQNFFYERKKLHYLSRHSTFFSNFKPFNKHNYHNNVDIPQLPVLDAIRQKARMASSHLLRNKGILLVDHTLNTSMSLINSMIKLGAQPKNILILGKYYSECPSIIEKIIKSGIYYRKSTMKPSLGNFYYDFTRDIILFWSDAIKVFSQRNINGIILLDHGGHCCAHVPQEICDKYPVVNIEKTTAGLKHPRYLDTRVPTIEVASCAAKKILESPLIAEAIVNKVIPYIPIQQEKLMCGVVGYGAIGQAMCQKLASMGHNVVIYDANPYKLENVKKIQKADSIYKISACCDYIFGCSGKDITESIDIFRYSRKNITLISCSSEDKEFLTLLNWLNKQIAKVESPLQDISFQNECGAIIRIIRGGFPINFDNSPESVPPRDIQLTRGLVLSGILQAVEFLKEKNLLYKAGGYMLDPNVQAFVVNEWLKCQPHDRFPFALLRKFKDEQWIIKHSGGTHVPLKEPLIRNQVSFDVEVVSTHPLTAC